MKLLKLTLITLTLLSLWGCDVDHHHYIYIFPIDIVEEDEETTQKAVWEKEIQILYI